jgi:hypothetical protein
MSAKVGKDVARAKASSSNTLVFGFSKTFWLMTAVTISYVVGQVYTVLLK